jgi:hypothetical protein
LTRHAAPAILRNRIETRDAPMRIAGLFAVVLLGWTLGPPARADLYGGYGLTAFPDCAAPAVIAKIHQKFAWSERYHGYRGVDLVGIERIGERRVEFFGERPIPRRYCHARALLSNGRTVSLPYLIEEGMWVAGTRWNVEFCATGHDRWHVYGGSCRVLRR